MMNINNRMVINKYRQGWILCLVVSFLLISNLALASPAAPIFPKLTGRIVDNADMLDLASIQRIEKQLKNHESSTTNQIVIVTLPNLGGYDIDSYGYQLGRDWGIGQKDKDNGVLLIVAQKERKVRIEVGYGLEGSLTDAISSNIIHSVIVPHFKKGLFISGIEDGATAIIQALGGKYNISDHQKDVVNAPLAVFFLFFIVIFSTFALFSGSSTRKGRSSNSGSSWGGGSSWSSGGGGGFSGGGGGFGGGGASGGW